MLTELAEAAQLNPQQFIGIPFALAGAVLLSLGAQYQHRGVRKVEGNTQQVEAGLNLKQLFLLLKRPSWLFGTIFLALAIVFQLISLRFSPLLVVQPLGVLALVLTAMLNSRVSRIRLNNRSKLAVLCCVIGVVVFVTIAAFTATESVVTDEQMGLILLLLAGVVVVYAVVFMLFRSRLTAIAYIIATGVIYGFVVTLAKVVILRFVQQDVNWLTLVCGVVLIGGALLGMYFVQNAYASGPPDLVIAGLTVIDPLVAVGIGVVVLGEAAFAPLWAVISFILAGGVAIFGVFMLAKHHPQIR